MDGEPLALATGSLERWLVERYCFFAVDRAQRPYIGEIQHVPWSVRRAWSSIRTNTMMAPLGLALPDIEPLCGAPGCAWLARSPGLTRVWAFAGVGADGARAAPACAFTERALII